MRSGKRWFGRWRLSRGRDGDHCLMINFRVALIQLGRQALGRFLLEELRPGSYSSADAGFPMDSVRFHKATVQ